MSKMHVFVGRMQARHFGRCRQQPLFSPVKNVLKHGLHQKTRFLPLERKELGP